MSYYHPSITKCDVMAIDMWNTVANHKKWRWSSELSVLKQMLSYLWGIQDGAAVFGTPPAPLSTNCFGLVDGCCIWSHHHAAWVSVSVSVYSKPPFKWSALGATATFSGINSTFPETPSLPAARPVSAAEDVAGEVDYMSSFGLTGFHLRSGVDIQRSWESRTPVPHGSVTDGLGPWTWQWPPFSAWPQDETNNTESRPRKSPTNSSCGFAPEQLAHAPHGTL